MSQKLTLVPILEEHELAHQTILPDIATQVLASTRKLYQQTKPQSPWLGYLAFQGKDCVGTCAFKSSPSNHRVEIAYFTFPGYENHGIATEMASQLVMIAIQELPTIGIFAQTLPTESASTSILKKLGFSFVGELSHETDGTVWEWLLQQNQGA